MNDPECMDGDQAVRDGEHDLDCACGREPAFARECFCQRLPFEQLHDDVGVVPLREPEVEDPDDGAMVHGGSGARFAPEPLAQKGSLRFAPVMVAVQQLHRDRQVEVDVGGAPDRAHSANRLGEQEAILAGEHVTRSVGMHEFGFSYESREGVTFKRAPSTSTAVVSGGSDDLRHVDYRQEQEQCRWRDARTFRASPVQSRRAGSDVRGVARSD